eukprot:6182138-Pleurochrysis_carterae.AAC.2
MAKGKPQRNAHRALLLWVRLSRQRVNAVLDARRRLRRHELIQLRSAQNSCQPSGLPSPSTLTLSRPACHSGLPLADGAPTAPKK